VIDIPSRWHLGWCKEDYFPHKRGFDSFLGIMHSGATYTTYESESPVAYDLWSDYTINSTYDGTYATDMYSEEADRIISNHDADTPLFMYLAMQHIHTPLEAGSYIDLFKGTAASMGINGKRKQGLAMIAALDAIVDNVYTSLETAGILDNTIIVFASDNGGQASSGGASNWPLRGQKMTLWEGGIRVPAFIYSKLFNGMGITGLTNNW
jgi:arylsulfatase A-like enzyme